MVKPSEPPLLPAHVYRIVKRAMQAAAEAAQIEGRHDFAAVLRQASTYWIRHARITHLVDAGTPLHLVQKFARHRDINTTMGYSHQQERELRRALAKAKDELQRALPPAPAAALPAADPKKG